MVRYLRSDATSLSDEDIREIINAKDLMNRASEIMAKKYKISPRRVYQIWRGEHPPLAPILINDITAPTFTAGNLATSSSTAGKLAASSSTAGNLSVSGDTATEMIEIKDDDLKA